jgi:hypothetical protein
MMPRFQRSHILSIGLLRSRQSQRPSLSPEMILPARDDQAQPWFVRIPRRRYSELSEV